MARIRSVHPALFTDEAWVSCSPLARILYIGLWTDADDQGLFEWKPLQIKMRLLPGDAANVSELLAELEGVGLIVAYEADGKRFGAIRNFRKFQRPQKPNAIHPLPESIAAVVGISATPNGTVRDQYDTDPETSSPMEDGGEGEGEEESQKGEPDGSLSPGGDVAPEKLPIREAFEAWNELAARTGLPTAKALSSQRRKQIRARLADAGLDGWKSALSAVAASPLCLGANDRGWRADLDFVCQPKSFNRLIEGFYTPKGSGPSPPTAAEMKPVSPEYLAQRRALLQGAR